MKSTSWMDKNKKFKLYYYLKNNNIWTKALVPTDMNKKTTDTDVIVVSPKDNYTYRWGVDLIGCVAER